MHAAQWRAIPLGVHARRYGVCFRSSCRAGVRIFQQVAAIGKARSRQYQFTVVVLGHWLGRMDASRLSHAELIAPVTQ